MKARNVLLSIAVELHRQASMRAVEALDTTAQAARVEQMVAMSTDETTERVVKELIADGDIAVEGDRVILLRGAKLPMPSMSKGGVA